MKNLCYLLFIIAIVSVVNAGQANLVTNGDFSLNADSNEITAPTSDVLGWSMWSDTEARVDPHRLYIGTATGASCWQNTEEVYQPDTVYKLTAKVKAGPDGNYSNGDFTLDIVDPNEDEWPVAASTEYTAGEEWETYSLEFDTADNPNAVGLEMGVSIHSNNDDVWGSSGSIEVTDVTLVVSSFESAWEPVPESGAENVGTVNGDYVQTTLEWKSGMDPNDPNVANPDITNHILYVDTNSANLGWGNGNIKEVDITANTPPDVNVQHTFSDLDYDTTYYWRVDEVINNASPDSNDANEVITGDVWSFTTIAEGPEITEQPSDLLIEDGETATFTVDVASVTPEHYQWYKSDDAVVDGGDTAISGTDSNTLTITAADMNTDESWYYVVVSNEGSSKTVTSEAVHLWFEREIGRWKLNDNLADDSGMGWTAEWDAVNDPCVGHQTFSTTAVEGTHSAEFQDDPNAFISVPGSEDYFNNYVVGMTASCWVKTDGSIDGWDPIIAKHSRSSMNSDQGWVLESNSGVPVFQVRGASVWAEGPAIDDSEWHMITVVYDVEKGNARLYVDGLLDSNDVDINPDGAVKSLDKFAIASEDTNEDATAEDAGSFDGLIDDVRVFTYPMTSKEVADMYFATLPDADPICLDNQLPEYDFNEDCIVNFVDFAMAAEDWFKCNVVPDCIQ